MVFDVSFCAEIEVFSYPCFWVKNGGVVIYYLLLNIDYWGGNGKENVKKLKKKLQNDKEKRKKRKKRRKIEKNGAKRCAYLYARHKNLLQC